MTIRKSAVWLAMCASCLAFNKAQAEPKTMKWLFGAKGGFNSAKFIGDPVGAFVSVPGLSASGQVSGWQEGFTAGAFVRHNASDNLGLQVELNFSQKGAEGPVSGIADVHYPGGVIRTADINGVMNVEMDYVEIPVFVVVSFPTDASEKATITASAGGYVAHNTAAWAKVQGQGRVVLPSGSTQISNFDQKWGLGSIVNRWDAGGLLGLGLEVALEKVELLFDFRWTFGFSSIDDVDPKSSIRNNVISLTLGVGLPRGIEIQSSN